MRFLYDKIFSLEFLICYRPPWLDKVVKYRHVRYNIDDLRKENEREEGNALCETFDSPAFKTRFSRKLVLKL